MFYDKFGVTIQFLVREHLDHELQGAQHVIVQFSKFGLKKDEFDVVLPAIASSFAHRLV